MPSSLLTRFTISVAGQATVFGEPFTTPSLTLEEDPAIYVVQIGINTTGTVWSGAPLPSVADFLAFTADQDCDLQFTVDGGQGDESHFTHFLRGGGFPLIIPGGQSYTGQTGSQDAFAHGTLKNITTVSALNRNTTTVCNIAVLIGKAG